MSGTSTTLDAQLVRSVKEQLDRGIPLGDIIARLAGSLATSVAAHLGISPQEAHERLTQAFTQALQPNDTGPPGTNAERASSLVSRLRQIAELATRVTNGDTGQPIRLIAGQRSDAEEAKAPPAPQPDSILRDALAALAVPASPATGATDLAAAPAASTPASDGRLVALDARTQAIATGGDTPLGRILARALQIADRSTPADETPKRNASTVLSSSDVIPSSSKDELTVHSAAADGGGSTTDAFLTAFASALAHAEDAPPKPAAQTAAAPADAAAPPISYAIPLVKDGLSITPPLPASTLPQPQHVDANAVVDQILRGMAIRTTDGQSEVRLRLVPEQLGDVSVKLIVSGGLVDASITAHTADAQNALAGAQNQLAKTFADAGLKLQSFTVALAGGAFADARDQSRHQDPWGKPQVRRIGGIAAFGSDDPDDASLLAVPSFGPSIYPTRPVPGALNTLA